MLRLILGGLFLAGILPVASTSAAIVNSVDAFSQVHGWEMNLGARVALEGGNQELKRFGADSRIQWQGELHRWRLMVDGELTEANGERIGEASLFHLRHNRRLRPWVATLAFAQQQRNPFRRLRSRQLLGAGIRFDLLPEGRGRLSLGLSPMLEHEELEGLEDSDTVRLSSFVAVQVELREGVKLAATSYMQPSLEDWSDLRAVGKVSLGVDLGAGLQLEWMATLEHDRAPPTDVEATDWGLLAGLRYRPLAPK